jgi:predicted secreted protein
MAVLAAIGFLTLTDATWPADQPSFEPVIVTSTDGTTSVTLQVNQQLVVQLPAQLGTGFSWRVDPDSTKALASLKSSEISAATQPGAPQIQALTFKATQPGSGTLKLVYGQPWRAEVAPSKVFQLHTTVRDSSPR